MKSALCALTLLSILAPVQADKGLDTIREYYTDTSNMTFYDATEQCKNTTKACITNLKYCDKSPYAFSDARCPDGFKEDNLSWWKREKPTKINFLRLIDSAVLLIDGAFGGSDMELRWVNTDPKYPTTIVWRGDYRGFYMYQVVEAGKTSWKFNMQTLREQMIPGWYVPANYSRTMPGTQDDQSVEDLSKAFSQAYATRFSIGQPEMSGDVYSGDNYTDSTSDFLFSNNNYFAWRNLMQEVNDLELQAAPSDKKWKIAVGVGVGVGVPVALVVGFVVGRLFGKRGAHGEKDTK